VSFTRTKQKETIMSIPSTPASRSFPTSARLSGIALALVGAIALVGPACGDDSSSTGGTAGSGGTGATGGSAGKAGGSGSGGSAGATDAGKSDSTGAGGASGAAGTAGAGGAAGKAGAGGTAGTGGAAGGAGTGGAAGSAGKAGSGGSSGGDAGPDVSADVGSDAPVACTDGGGPVYIDAAPPDASGPDMHCIADDGGKIINTATFCPGPDAVAPPNPDAGDDGGTEPLPDPHYGTEADDDDCKSHVSYTASCIQQNQDVTFTVTQKWLATSTNSTGADPHVEAFIGNHPSITTGTATDNGNGVYTISGIRFDRAGVWTVRLHFFETCEDVDDSYHSHIAFYVRVP
jgi:hypothetical protein